MADPDHGVQEQAFNVLRNIAEDEPGIELIFHEMDAESLLQSVFFSAAGDFFWSILLR